MNMIVTTCFARDAAKVKLNARTRKAYKQQANRRYRRTMRQRLACWEWDEAGDVVVEMHRGVKLVTSYDVW